MTSATKTAFFLTLAAGSTVAIHGQGDREGAAGTGALIAEVRQLRATIERAIAIAPRVQLMMWRVGVQDQRVQRLSARLTDIQEMLSDLTTSRDRHLRMVREQEERLASEREPSVRRQIETRVRDMREQWAYFTERETELRNAEADVGGNLRREQALLADVLRQTEALADTMRSTR